MTSSTLPASSQRRLEVTGRAAARYLDISADAVIVASKAGLLPPYGTGYDAEDVLALGQRPELDPQQLQQTFPAASILLVQQTYQRPDDEQPSWREAWGWSTELSPQQALLSASGWWPVPPERRSGLIGLVSTVSGFVVTLAVVDPERPVHSVHPSDGRVRLNVRRATRRTPAGARLLDVFGGRRVPTQRGSSRLIP